MSPINTGELWGLDQAEIYLDLLRVILEKLAVQPRLVRPFSDVRAGYCRYPAGSSVLFFKIDERGIHVIRFATSAWISVGTVIGISATAIIASVYGKVKSSVPGRPNSRSLFQQRCRIFPIDRFADLERQIKSFQESVEFVLVIIPAEQQPVPVLFQENPRVHGISLNRNAARAR